MPSLLQCLNRSLSRGRQALLFLVGTALQLHSWDRPPFLSQLQGGKGGRNSAQLRAGGGSCEPKWHRRPPLKTFTQVCKHTVREYFLGSLLPKCVSVQTFLATRTETSCGETQWERACPLCCNASTDLCPEDDRLCCFWSEPHCNSTPGIGPLSIPSMVLGGPSSLSPIVHANT